MKCSEISVIILAGGFGTRLRSEIGELPKVLADVNGKPFIFWLLAHLNGVGVRRVLLSVGYKWALVREVVGHSFDQITIEYVVEEAPLGTGGAIKRALSQIAPDSVALILNGDTYCPFDPCEMIEAFEEFQPDVLLGVKQMSNFDRYGRIEICGDRITNFVEKQFCKTGFISIGVYMVGGGFLNLLPSLEKFSFEVDFLAKNHNSMNLRPFIVNCDFVDIGIPLDYRLAAGIVGKAGGSL